MRRRLTTCVSDAAVNLHICPEETQAAVAVSDAGGHPAVFMQGRAGCVHSQTATDTDGRRASRRGSVTLHRLLQHVHHPGYALTAFQAILAAALQQAVCGVTVQPFAVTCEECTPLQLETVQQAELLYPTCYPYQHSCYQG